MTTTSNRPKPIKWRPFRRPSRLIPAAGVITALIAAIALANGSWSSNEPAAAENSLTAAIPHSKQGAQRAATTMATALGNEEMFNPASRHELVQALVHPSHRDEMQKRMDAQYTAFNRKIGLGAGGQPPEGATFVSRTMPAGVILRSYRAEEVDVDVWFSSLFGLTGTTVDEIPMDTNWYTMTMTLRWSDDGWKLIKFTQQDGPEPTDAAANYGQAPQL